MSESNSIKLWKMNKAWDLANRIMQQSPGSGLVMFGPEREYATRTEKALATAYKATESFPKPPS